MSDYKVEQVGIEISILGEEPHWDANSQSLFYIDILGAKLYRYDYNKNETYVVKIDGVDEIQFVIPVEGQKEQFAVGCRHRICIISWDGISTKAQFVREVGQIESEPDFQLRINDTKADSHGRLVGGTMLADFRKAIEIKKGSVFQFTKENGYKELRGGVRLSNGLVWNENLNKFYFIDSCDYDVKEYDYDIKTGKISNERVVFKLVDASISRSQVADGMTIDSDGNLYIAFVGASKILKINPNVGEIELEIKLPCELVTSCAFGGPELDVLYVTTGSTQMDGIVQKLPAGSLFKVTGLNVKGTKMNNVCF